MVPNWAARDRDNSSRGRPRWHPEVAIIAMRRLAGARHLGRRGAHRGPRVRCHQVRLTERQVGAENRRDTGFRQRQEVLRHQPERSDHDTREALLDRLPQVRPLLVPVRVRIADHDVQTERAQLFLEGGRELGGLDRSGTTSATMPERPVRRLRATVLTVNPRSAMAASTTCRVSSATARLPERTCDTVAVDTPTARATSAMVIRTVNAHAPSARLATLLHAALPQVKCVFPGIGPSWWCHNGARRTAASTCSPGPCPASGPRRGKAAPAVLPRGAAFPRR